MRRGRKINTYTPVGDIMVNLEYYWSKQEPPDANGCIGWTGGRHKQGYPMMGGYRGDRRMMTVTHRITAMLKFGRALATDEFVIHTCSNPNCLTPEHLILGDYHTKNQVMDANNRRHTGSRNHVRKIQKQNRKYRYTEEEVRWIRTAESQAIADRYNITKARASKLRWAIRQGFKWIK